MPLVKHGQDKPPLPPTVLDTKEIKVPLNPLVQHGWGTLVDGKFTVWADYWRQRYAALSEAERRKFTRRLLTVKLPYLWTVVLQGAVNAGVVSVKGETMPVNMKSALLRLGRAMLYGGIAAGMTHLLGHTAEFVPGGMFMPLATAILMAADKFVRSELHDMLVGSDEGENVP